MIIVTGANGFIGSAMVSELNQRRIKDIICVDSVDRKKHDLLKQAQFAEFLNHDQFLDELPSLKPTAIIHMGACSSTTEMNVAFLTKNNVEYTKTLWQFCTQYQIPFLYASSGAVYGDGSNGFDDASPTQLFSPLNPYGESKAAFDRWVEMQTVTPPNWYGLRFFNVYGPNEYFKGEMASVVFKACQQIKATGSLTLFKSHHPDYQDGYQLRDFVYIKDITRWMAELLEKKLQPSGLYNMGFGKARPWMDLATQTFRSLKREVRINWIDIPEQLRPRYQYFTEANMTRSWALGLSKPQWSLEAGIADYVENYLDEALLGERRFF